VEERKEVWKRGESRGGKVEKGVKGEKAWKKQEERKDGGMEDISGEEHRRGQGSNE